MRAVLLAGADRDDEARVARQNLGHGAGSGVFEQLRPCRGHMEGNGHLGQE